MSFTLHISEWTFTNLVQGLVFVAASVFVLMLLFKVRRVSNAIHFKWLVPMAFYTVSQSITYALTVVYDSSEPEPLNTIADVVDDISLLAFLWALVVLWRLIQDRPELLKTPWLSVNETPEGVWPPAPKAQ